MLFAPMEMKLTHIPDDRHRVFIQAFSFTTASPCTRQAILVSFHMDSNLPPTSPLLFLSNLNIDLQKKSYIHLSLKNSNTMKSFTILFSALIASLSVQARQLDSVSDNGAFSFYGYIAIVVIILILVIAILVRRQRRKFNE